MVRIKASEYSYNPNLVQPLEYLPTLAVAEGVSLVMANLLRVVVAVSEPTMRVSWLGA